MTPGKFQKILIANRGEIAVRIERTCRLLGIQTVALYTPADQNSLHVRLADQCIPVTSQAIFFDPEWVLRIAKENDVDAVHPGYGFLAERPDFILACREAGITVIGPPVELVTELTDKIAVLEKAAKAGFPVVQHSGLCFDELAITRLAEAADRLGYPVVVKSCLGGRGRGERLVRARGQLEQAIRRAEAESQAFYGRRSVFLEKAILPAHQVNVQILGDRYGQRVHLGEREGSVLRGNQKLVEESPAPFCSPELRDQIWQMALGLADLFELENACSIEFLIDTQGQPFFTEIKTRLQVEHPLTECRSGIDLVAEQIRLAAGDRLGYNQADVHLSGWSILCRVTAEDPLNNFLPSPGVLRNVRLPAGPEVRIDTFISSGCTISPDYDPLLAKLTVWGSDRSVCLRRLQDALAEFHISGLPTNVPALESTLVAPALQAGCYDSGLDVSALLSEIGKPLPNSPDMDKALRDLAVAAAVYYLRRSQVVQPERPDRLNSGWHRHSRGNF